METFQCAVYILTWCWGNGEHLGVMVTQTGKVLTLFRGFKTRGRMQYLRILSIIVQGGVI